MHANMHANMHATMHATMHANIHANMHANMTSNPPFVDKQPTLFETPYYDTKCVPPLFLYANTA